MLKKQRTLTISQAADELGVSRNWLRLGDRLESLPLAPRTQSGWRHYTPDDVERLRRLGVGERKRQIKAAHE